MDVLCKEVDLVVVVIIVRVGVICTEVLGRGRGSVIAKCGCGSGNLIVVGAKSIAKMWMWWRW